MSGSRVGRVATIVLALLGSTALAAAATCGNGANGFDAWKRQFTEEARGKVGERAMSALEATHYSAATIGSDHGKHGFNVTLETFLAKRGGATVAARGRSLKNSQAALFNSIEQRYGVPPGPLIAIWGFESGFGNVHGNEDALSAVATLAYDCRRSAYFTDQLYAALKLIDEGRLAPGARGSMHGEIGQTQFLPKTMLEYGVGGNLDNASAALMSTANFLKAHGWQAGAGYQPGEPNFAAIQAWNAASIYERAIAVVGRQIDGGR
jgi:membrane-bound lytic murein transglycosylase B